MELLNVCEGFRPSVTRKWRSPRVQGYFEADDPYTTMGPENIVWVVIPPQVT